MLEKSRLSTPVAVPELDKLSYTFEEAAAGVGIKPGLLRTWITRSPIVIALGGREQKPKKGVPGRLTLRRVIAIALVAELVALGVRPALAGSIAFNFTDGNRNDRPCLEWRQLPILLVYPQSGGFRFIPSAELSIKAAFDDLACPASFVALSASAVIQRVKERLATLE